MKRKLWLFAMLSLLGLQPARATLIMCLLHKETMYLASDSLLTYVGGTSNTLVQKTFPIATNASAALCGGYGVVTRRTTKDLGGWLHRKCASLYSKPYPLRDKMGDIFTGFKKEYNEVSNLVANADIKTELIFCGYDEKSDKFFCESCTNAGPFGFQFELAPNETSVFVTFGGGGFETALFSPIGPPPEDPPNDRFKEWRSDEFIRLVREIRFNNPMTEDEIIKWLLMLFDLHKKHAAEAVKNPGDIGPPYVIYKITKTHVTKIR